MRRTGEGTMANPVCPTPESGNILAQASKQASKQASRTGASFGDAIRHFAFPFSGPPSSPPLFSLFPLLWDDGPDLPTSWLPSRIFG